VGVDLKPQRNYPFDFIQADALEYLAQIDPVTGMAGAPSFDAIHASPPCQAYSVATSRWGQAHQNGHPDLIARTRELLEGSGLPWVIENVPGSPLRAPVQLCGSSFGLDLQRHRLFESSFPLLAPPCVHGWQTPRFPPNRSGRKGRRARVICVAGHGSRRLDVDEGGGKASVAEWRRVMEIDWASNRDELREAIPPAYTELVGHQLLAQVGLVTA
jgi:DNA (cytosine-5)-methyltransferase 1